jgi:hypothetical protein
MAVLYQFLEGFSGYGTLAAVNQVWGIYATPNSTWAALSVGPFAGTTSIAIRNSATASGGTFAVQMQSSGSWCKFGFWMLRDGAASSVFPFMIYEGTTEHLTLEVSAAGNIALRRGGTGGTLLGTSAAPHITNINQWYWIEGRIRIADSINAGDAVVTVDGVQALSLSAGADTRNGLTGICDRIRLFSRASTEPSVYFSGLYFELVEGQSDALYGPCRVDTVYPTSDGHHQDGTPSAGADRWAVVDDGTLDDGDYTDLADVGDRDSFGVGTIPALVDATVYGVQVQVMAQSSDAGARSMAPMLRVGSTDYDGGASALSPSLLGYTAAWPTNPAGGAWTQSAAQSAQPGAVVTA